MNRSIRSKSVLFAILGILVIFAVGFTITTATRPVHCVSGVEPTDAVTSPSEPPLAYRCFDNQAEAINYATGGQVNLPRNASSADIDAALRALDANAQ